MLVIEQDKLLIGWCEWCQLPKLNLPAIKAKIDTGAQTSALHAFDIRPFCQNGQEWVCFSAHPIQGNDEIIVECTAEVVGKRHIMSSNGHIEHRYVIKTPLTLDNQTWDIEITLSDRDPLKFRMLLGRQALRKHIIIDPNRILYQGKIRKDDLYAMYMK